MLTTVQKKPVALATPLANVWYTVEYFMCDNLFTDLTQQSNVQKIY